MRPFRKELDKLYATFHQDHARLRRDLLVSLPERGAPKEQTRRAPSGPVSGDRLMLNRIAKIAAAVVLTTAGIGIIGHFMGTEPTSSVAFGDVLAYIHNSTYTFDLTTAVKGQDEAIIAKGMVQQPGRMRLETSSLGISTIVDLDAGKCLQLLHPQKTVMIQTAQIPDDAEGAGPLAMLTGPVGNLWNLRDGTEKPLGEKEIEGQPAVGFEVEQNTPPSACRTVVWVHRDSGLPILFESTIYNPQDGSESIKMTMDHFDLDVELDDALFSLEVPGGYTVANQNTLEETLTDTVASPKGQKLEHALQLWDEDQQDQAVEAFLSIDWTESMVFSSDAYLLTMTEQDYIALKHEDQMEVSRKASETARRLRDLARKVWELAGTDRSNRDYALAEQRLTATLNLGQMLCDNPDRMLTLRLLGPAIVKGTLLEFKTLYEETDRTEDLRRVEEQIAETDALREAILREARGQ